MSTRLEEAPQEDQAPAESLQDTAEQREALFAEARELLEKGNPWKALPKKAEALGLKPLESFNSMRRQDLQKRPDLVAAGNPLSDMPHAAERFSLEAAAKLYPTSDGAEAMLKDLQEAAAQTPTETNQTERAQARKARDEIQTERRKLQYKKAFDEVGTYGRYAGWVAARAGNGDLLFAQDAPEKLEVLASAGYKETPGGYGSHGGPTTPFSANQETTKDVKWAPATGAEPEIS